jgi:SAM-dependent methyltransferase
MSFSAPTRACPICLEPQADRISQMCFPLFNDTPIRGEVTLANCPRCGFVYYDTPSSANDFDDFYEHHYFVRSYSLRKGHPAEMAYLGATVGILQAGGVPRDGKVVDVGCGPGHLLERMRAEGYSQLLGLELCSAYVDEMRAAGIPAAVASAHDFTLAEGQADCLIFKNIFEHFLEFQSVLDSIERNLKPGGYVFIEVPDAARYADFPDYAPLSYLTLEHINHFDRAHIEALFAARGFETVLWGTRMLDIAERFPVPIQHILLRRGTGQRQSPAADFTLRDMFKECIGDPARFLAPELESLRAAQSPVKVWGLSYRTLAWLGMSPLAECRITQLLDSDERKQQRSLLGLRIEAPEALRGATMDDTVVIGVGPSSGHMQRMLRDWGFKGRIVVLD